MVEVRVWYKESWGIFRYFWKQPCFLVVLHDAAGRQYPIYETSNVLENAGTYQISLYQPWNEPKQVDSAGFFTVKPSDTVVNIVVENSLGTEMAHVPRNWAEYVEKYRERLDRPLIWHEPDAVKLIRWK